ncbi:MucB/RseB C-terminal domain-containing protein [Thalassotalea agarivorans]|nr:MucB/RseB C-terminal domain-containing protein [Thalassotalea agarivorans]
MCLLVISLPATATEAPKSAEQLLSQLANTLKNTNFTTSFVVVKNNHADPYHWFHGVGENGDQLSIVSLLNGPRRDILRRGDTVSYVEPEFAPYSIEAKHISSPIPSILSGDILSLNDSYNFVLVGKNRVLGRPAQLIRLVSKDPHKYGHWLWLDQQTSFPLKIAIANKKGQLLEQIQFTHLDVSSNLSEQLLQLSQAELPPVVESPAENDNVQLKWRLSWLPVGFESIATNRHRMSMTKQPVEYRLFSDGLVDFSVYVGPSNDSAREQSYVLDGATVVLNQVVNGIEVSLVGKVPVETAKAIVAGVVVD